MSGFSRSVFRAASLMAVCLAGAHVALASETTTYTYDALGRLVAVTSAGTVNNGQNVSTSFDPAGNRTSYSVSGAGGNSSTISVAGTTTTEGGVLSFVATRTGSTAAAATVSFATANGTAVAPGDYGSSSGTLTFPVGQSSAVIAISTVDDTAVESAETLSVILSNPSSGLSIGTGTATGTINDNDTLWTAALVKGSVGSVCYATPCSSPQGYILGTVGSLTPNSYGGNTIDRVYVVGSGIYFGMSGTSAPPANAGWTQVYIPGVGYKTRSSASYTTSGNYATWQWPAGGSIVASGNLTVQ